MCPYARVISGVLQLYETLIKITCVHTTVDMLSIAHYVHKVCTSTCHYVQPALVQMSIFLNVHLSMYICTYIHKFSVIRSTQVCLTVTIET